MSKLPAAVENLCCEVYNPGTEKNWNVKAYDMLFVSTHPQKHMMHFFGKPPMVWDKILCKVGEWKLLPHGMYDVKYYDNGREVFGVENYASITNFGSAIGVGNKAPSAPENKKIRVFQ